MRSYGLTENIDFRIAQECIADQSANIERCCAPHKTKTTMFIFIGYSGYKAELWLQFVYI